MQENLIATVCAYGGKTDDLRDAAHEACHALELNVPAGQWDRDSIHEVVRRLPKQRLAATEVRARAVEQLVCTMFGVDAGDIEFWACITVMEGVRGGLIMFPAASTVAQWIRDDMQSAAAKDLAVRVAALGVIQKHNPKRKRPRT